MKKISFYLTLLVLCLLFACESNTSSAPSIGIVDVERVMRESSPAQTARKHLEESQNILQKGLQALEEEWKTAPEVERRKVLAEGLNALNQRMVAEENSANLRVRTLLHEECEKWRATHKALFVTSRQNLLATDNAVDITSEIVAAMNARVLEFSTLPAVQVKKRKDINATKEEQNSQVKRKQ